MHRIVLLAAAFLAALPAAAQDVPLASIPVPPPEPSPVWNDSRNSEGCASQSPAEMVPAITLTQKADGTPRLLIDGPGWRGHAAGAVTLQGSDPMTSAPLARTAAARPGPAGMGTILDLPPLEDVLYDNFGDLRVLDGASGAPIGTLSLVAFSHPRHWVRRCTAEMRRIDPGSGKPAVTDPQFVANPITNDDYPAPALRAEMEGATLARITVSAKGLVSECAVAASSGYSILDETSCNLISRRGRFTPATDADGHATQATILRRFVWRIPK